MMKWWWNDDEMNDETYDEIAVKTYSKCLACMTGYLDPDFEPSVEEIMDYQYMAILSVCFLWRACTLGGFPYSV